MRFGAPARHLEKNLYLLRLEALFLKELRIEIGVVFTSMMTAGSEDTALGVALQ
jgi:hypothetical protein